MPPVIQSNPAPISKPPETPFSKHPIGSKVIKSINGVKYGPRPAHNVSILDMTADGTQVFPLLVHCDTCAWESRQLVLANAIEAASRHAGV